MVVAAFEGGFSSEISGLYKCISADGYLKESYIVLSEGEFISLSLSHLCVISHVIY